MASKCLAVALNIGTRRLYIDKLVKLTTSKNYVLLPAIVTRQFSSEEAAETCPPTISLKEIYKLEAAPSYQASPQFNTFSTRTHTCGELRLADLGATVRICGWVTYKRLNMFLVIKDCYGVTQLLLENAVIEEGLSADKIPLESVVLAEGVVIDRGENRNPKMPTGEVEIAAHRIKVLNACRESLPFHPTSPLKYGERNEKDRLTNRYLDLRMDRMQVETHFTLKFALTLSQRKLCQQSTRRSLYIFG